ncbi:MAG TPA: hypothetical protein VF941_09410 [Clostridia bacterium]
MVRKGKGQSLNMINARYPCGLKTKQCIGIGSTKEEVISAYKNLINQEEFNRDNNRIVIGTVYGGIIFSFDNNKVSKVFIGAAAE